MLMLHVCLDPYFATVCRQQRHKLVLLLCCTHVPVSCPIMLLFTNMGATCVELGIQRRHARQCNCVTNLDQSIQRHLLSLLAFGFLIVHD